MHQIRVSTTTRHDIEARWEKHGLSSTEFRRVLAWERPVAIVLRAGVVDRAVPTRLLFFLANVGAHELESLAGGQFTEYNELEDDGLACTTYLSWRTPFTELRVDAYLVCPDFPGGIGDRTFEVIFVGGNVAVVATHIVDRYCMDALLGGLQGALAGSGMNFRPKAASTGLPVARPEDDEGISARVLTAKVLTIEPR